MDYLLSREKTSSLGQPLRARSILVNRTISTDDLHFYPWIDKVSVSVNRPDVEMHYSVFN